MANGNHQQGSGQSGGNQPGGRQHGGQGGGQQPPGGGGGHQGGGHQGGGPQGGGRPPSGGGGGGGGGNDLLSSGWGEGRSSVDELQDNVKLVFETVKGPILFAWLAVAVVALVIAEFVAGVQTVLYLVSGSVSSLIILPLEFLARIVIAVLGPLQFAMMGAVRSSIFEQSKYDSLMDVIRQASGRWMWVLLATFGIMLGQMILFCLPFVVLITLSAVPYVVATREMPLGEAFKTGFEWFKRHYIVLLVTFGVTIAVVFAAVCPVGACFWAGTLLPNSVEPMVMAGTSWALFTVLQLMIFVVVGGAYVTIDAHESGFNLDSVRPGPAGPTGQGETAEREW